MPFAVALERKSPLAVAALVLALLRVVENMVEHAAILFGRVWALQALVNLV